MRRRHCDYYTYNQLSLSHFILAVRFFGVEIDIYILKMIKLIRLIPKHVREGIDVPPEVSFITPPSHHSYAKAAGDGAGKQYFQGNIDFTSGESDNNIARQAAEVIKRFENNPNLKGGGYDKERKRWFPHRSIEGGTPTIAYGHKMKQSEDFASGITDSEAQDLLLKDVRIKIDDLKHKIKNFDSLPSTIKIASINAMFRGDMGHKTMALLSQNQFSNAAKEYLNHAEYRTTHNPGVKKRMEWNAAVFKKAA